MIKQPAKVIAETSTSYLLETLPKAACPRCEAGNGCGGGILAQAFANKTHRLSINKNKPLKLQQSVQLGISSSILIRASIILYFLPLLMMVIAAIVVGNFMNDHDLYTVLAATGGFLVGAIFAKGLSEIFLKQGMASLTIIDDTNSCWYQK